MNIRDRIVELRRVKRGEILPHPLNFRRHPENQRQALRGILSDIGVAGAALAYYSEANSGALTFIDGHLRDEEIPDGLPVLITDLNDAEAALLLVTYDPLSAMASTDKKQLDSLLREVGTGDVALLEMIAATAKDAGLTWGAPPVEAPEAQVDRAAELQKKWKTERGQLWEIGKHRLLCGDSTSANDVARLMVGERAALLASDPPYNVDKDYGEQVDDALVESDYKEFTLAWFDLWRGVSDRQIVTPGCNNLARWCRYFDPYHIAPWTKTNSMTNGKVARWWCWEPVFFIGDGWARDRSNDVFDFPIGQQSGVANHPCPKPLKMWADLITNYSKEGESIADAFCGAGTSIVAAEQAGRKAFTMELGPQWVAVTLDRLKAMGLAPKLEAPNVAVTTGRKSKNVPQVTPARRRVPQKATRLKRK